jgi:hypothetical protein
MAAGLPVVATDVGGNREVVVHGKTGFLVPVRSPEVMAQALLSLLRDPALARRLGLAGRGRVEQFFDVRQVVLQYERLYLGLLRKKDLYPFPREVQRVPRLCQPWKQTANFQLFRTADTAVAPRANPSVEE